MKDQTGIRELPDWYETIQRAPERVADYIDDRTAPRPWYHPTQVGGSLLVAVLTLTWMLAVIPLAGFERAYTIHPLRGPVTWLFGVYELLGVVVLLPFAVVIIVTGATIAAVCFLPYLVAWVPVAIARFALGRPRARTDTSTTDSTTPDIWMMLLEWEYGESWVGGIVTDAGTRARVSLAGGRYGRGLLWFSAGWVVVLLAPLGYGLFAAMVVFFYLFLLGLGATMLMGGWQVVFGHPLIDPLIRVAVVLPIGIAGVSFAARYLRSLGWR